MTELVENDVEVKVVDVVVDVVVLDDDVVVVVVVDTPVVVTMTSNSAEAKSPDEPVTTMFEIPGVAPLLTVNEPARLPPVMLHVGTGDAAITFGTETVQLVSAKLKPVPVKETVSPGLA